MQSLELTKTTENEHFQGNNSATDGGMEQHGAKRIIKTDTSHQTATFVILEPNSIDFNGQIISEEEIIKTAHEFMENLTKKYININHTEDSKQDDVKYVESFISPVDLVLGDATIKKGSWLVAFKFSDEKWQQVRNGEIVGVSMEGFGYVD